jgi:hypothetical protein
MSYNPYEEQFHEELMAKGYMLEREEDLDALEFDEGTQMRVSTNWDKVAEYRDKWLVGERFPPIDVFYDPKDYLQRIADGIHRYLAAKEAGLKKIPIRVFRGSRRDAILYACKANGKHGFSSSDEDKRKAVLTLLADDEWKVRSNPWIAEQCNCGATLVWNLREEIKASQPADHAKQSSQPGSASSLSREDSTTNPSEINDSENSTPEIRMVKRGGREFPMKINNIGAKQKEASNANLSRGTGRQPAQTQQNSAPLPENADPQRPNPLSSPPKAQPTQQSPQVVTCCGCREDFNKADCTELGGPHYLCEDCAARSQCDGCDETFTAQNLKAFDDFLYCTVCTGPAERLRQTAANDTHEENSFNLGEHGISGQEEVALLPQEKLKTSPPLVITQATQPETKSEAKGQPTIQPSGHDSWCTPPELLGYIHQFTGGIIALDPCSNPYAITQPLLQFYKEDNGLEKDWATELEAQRLKGLVYVNPPYDTETLEKVSSKCAEQSQRGLEVLSLVPCKLDQEWWQSTVFDTVNALCFVKGRIKFWEDGRPKSGAPMPCAFLYWGARSEFFEVVFSGLGRVLSLELLREAKAANSNKPVLSLVKGGDE